MLRCIFIILLALFHIAYPHISKESGPFLILFKNLLEILSNFFHGLVVWGHTSSNQAVRVRVAVIYVHSTIFDCSQKHFCHIKSSRPRANDSEPHLFWIFYKILILLFFIELRIIIFWRIEGHSSFRNLLKHFCKPQNYYFNF